MSANSVYPSLSSSISLSPTSSLLTASAHTSNLSLASHYHILGNEYLDSGEYEQTAGAWLNAAMAIIVAKQQQNGNANGNGNNTKNQE